MLPAMLIGGKCQRLPAWQGRARVRHFQEQRAAYGWSGGAPGLESGMGGVNRAAGIFAFAGGDMGGYRAAVRDSRLPAPPERYTIALEKSQRDEKK